MFGGRVLPQNHHMLEVFRKSGFPVHMRSGPGEILVEYPTSISEEALERFERREQTTTAAALRGSWLRAPSP